MSITRNRAAAAALVAASAAALTLPSLSSGHATISAIQPQGSLLTGARTSYVVRAPNERDKQSTYKLTMYVPATVQEAISVRQTPGWKIRLDRVDTGKRGPEGETIYGIRKISWTAASKDQEIEPGMYGEWGVRFQNPAFATKLCFGMTQVYRNVNGSRRKPEFVQWTGPADAETPSSCINIVDAPK